MTTQQPTIKQLLHRLQMFIDREKIMRQRNFKDAEQKSKLKEVASAQQDIEALRHAIRTGGTYE